MRCKICNMILEEVEIGSQEGMEHNIQCQRKEFDRVNSINDHLINAMEAIVKKIMNVFNDVQEKNIIHDKFNKRRSGDLQQGVKT